MVVEDDSMVPTLRPGDRLLVDPAPYRRRAPARGEIVVVRDPERRDRLLVKRVAAAGGEPLAGGGTVPAGSVYVVGDAPQLSRDSRTFGPIDRRAAVGLVWFRYAPADRRGPIGSGPPG